MTIRDRGNKKWTSFWMPEHVSMLKGIARDYEKVERPILDEHAIEEIEETIGLAMEYNDQLEFTTWHNGFFSTVVGRVHYVDTLNKNLRIIDEEGSVVVIKFRDLARVRSVD
jgi:hypothetical protein